MATISINGEAAIELRELWTAPNYTSWEGQAHSDQEPSFDENSGMVPTVVTFDRGTMTGLAHIEKVGWDGQRWVIAVSSTGEIATAPPA